MRPIQKSCGLNKSSDGHGSFKRKAGNHVGFVKKKGKTLTNTLEATGKHESKEGGMAAQKFLAQILRTRLPLLIEDKEQ